MTEQQHMPLNEERAVLGAILLAGTTILEPLLAETGLRPGHFAYDQHREPFEAMVRLHDRGDAIDHLTVTAELRASGRLDAIGGPATIEALAAAVPITGNAQTYAKTVIGEARWRARKTAWLHQGAAIDRGDEASYQAVIEPTEPDRGDVLEPDALVHRFEAWLERDEDVIPTPWLEINDALHGGARRGDTTIVAGWTSMGKALDVETPIPTPDGWTTMLDLKRGDYVFGANGRPTRVVDAWPVLLGRPCYRVSFSDGASIVADADHLWTIETFGSRRSARAAALRAGTQLELGHQDQSAKRIRPVTLTTSDLRELLGEVTRRPSIPCADPADLPARVLPMDPYVLGAWLGDGDSGSATLTCHSREADYFEHQLRLAGERVAVTHAPDRPIARVRFGSLRGIGECHRGHPRTPGTNCAGCQHLHWIARRDGVAVNDLAPRIHFTAVERLREMGVLRNKHIPADYFRASRGQRLALLQGIVDTDGHVAPHGQLDIALCSERLATDVRDLALTLGLRPTLTTRPAKLYGRTVGTVYRIVCMPDLPVARMPRKASRVRTWSTTKAKHRYVMSVEPVPSRPVRCIAVEAHDQLFLAGREWIATHNSLASIAWLDHVAALGGRAGLYTNEMAVEDVTARLLAAHSGVSFGRIMRRELAGQHRDALRAAYEKLAVRIIPVYGWPWQDIARHIRRQRWDLCCLDLFTRLPDLERVSLIDAAISGLCNAAAQSGVHLVVVAQLNQERSKMAERPTPTKRDLRGSGAMANDPANVVFVHRDQEVSDSGIVTELDSGVIYLGKARNGSLGKPCAVRLNAARMRFESGDEWRGRHLEAA